MKEQGKLTFGILGAFVIAFAISGCYYSIGLYKFNKEHPGSELAMNSMFTWKSKNEENTSPAKEEKKATVDTKSINIDSIVKAEEKKQEGPKIVDWTDEDGNIIGTKEYKDAKHVVMTARDEYGKVSSVTTGIEKNGKLEGEVTVDYPSGDKDIYTYRKGVRHGAATLIFANGDQQACKYVNGKLNGKAVYFFENGDREEYTYEDGVPEGNARYIYANGNIEEYRYEHGERK